MSKVLILYGTYTNNTEDAATALQQTLAGQLPQGQFDLANINNFDFKLLPQYSKVIFGTSTWDDAYNPDTEQFISELEQAKPDLSTVQIAFFGLGDISYPDFCAATYAAKAVFESLGAKSYSTVFTIDGYPTDPLLADLALWAKGFVG